MYFTLDSTLPLVWARYRALFQGRLVDADGDLGAAIRCLQACVGTTRAEKSAIEVETDFGAESADRTSAGAAAFYRGLSARAYEPYRKVIELGCRHATAI